MERSRPDTPGQAEGRREPVRAAVLGATGYAGRELILLLTRHTGVRITRLMSSGRDGREAVDAAEAHPVLRGVSPVPIEPLNVEVLKAGETDIAFLATPHEASHRLAPALIARGVRVVDLSGAFRLRDPNAYPEWYGFEHRADRELADAVYGIPELNAAAIRQAKLVANPGCYPTAVILAVAPLLRAGLVDTSAGIVCDAKSGATGAGRSLRDDLLFASVSENCRAYGVFRHRHLPEILQELALNPGDLTFTPHLLPILRGILTTTYLRLTKLAAKEEVLRLFEEFYGEAPLVRIYPNGKLPEIQAVAHTQFADLGVSADPATRRCVIVSAIDNLGKGAAGQAIQNMNLMCGFREDEGLR